MARALVWLENSTFAAWGCEACGWIMPKPRSVSDTPPAEVKEAFNKHEVSETPTQDRADMSGRHDQECTFPLPFLGSCP